MSARSPQRLDELLGQDTVYLTGTAGRRSKTKIHTDPDCQYLHRKDAEPMSKPANSYPVGFYDLCSTCSGADGDE